MKSGALSEHGDAQIWCVIFKGRYFSLGYCQMIFIFVALFVCLLVFFVVDLLGIFCFVLVLLVFFFLPSLGAHCNSGHSSFLKMT